MLSLELKKITLNSIDGSALLDFNLSLICTLCLHSIPFLQNPLNQSMNHSLFVWADLTFCSLFIGFMIPPPNWLLLTCCLSSLSLVDNIEFLASQGITFPPEDISVASSSAKLSQATTSISSLTNSSRPVTTRAPVVASQSKPTITRIVRLNSAGQGAQAPAFKIVPASSQALSTTSSKGPKIIKVTPEQFEALKSGFSF